MSFFELLEARVAACDSLLCIGLDPHVGQLKRADGGTPTAQDARDFCLRIINESHPYAAAFKPNSAFFECFGAEGFAALSEVISAVPSDIPVILDVKRGDIETTAQAYASAAYDIFKVGSVTIAPYMGWDSVSPFITGKYEGKGVFVLCKTSNKSSNDFQREREDSGADDKYKPLYEKVALKCASWNSELPKPSIGLVVGATDLKAIRKVRQVYQSAWILCPGVGAQGGKAEDVCACGLREDGSGMLVSVSRGVSSAPNIPEAAAKLRDDINLCRLTKSSTRQTQTDTNLKEFQRNFIIFALKNEVLQFGSFVLKSGRTSPYFFNAGLFCSGTAMRSLGRFYAQALHEAAVDFDVIFGPAYKGIPLATAIGIAWYDLYGEDKDVTFNRKEVKDHGEGGNLVGARIRDRKVVIVDDVISAGTAIRESLDILKAAGAIVAGIVVSLDRQEVRSEEIRESAIQQVMKDTGVPVVSIVKLKNLITYLETQEGTTLEQLEAIRAYRSEYGVDY